MTVAHFAAYCSGSFLISSHRPTNSIWDFSRTECWFGKPRSCRPLISMWESNKTQLHVIKISGAAIQPSLPEYRFKKCAVTGGNSSQRLLSEDGFDHEPFWLSLIKDLVWSTKSLAIFMAEQPSQLKYIEWPTFQSTLKTAALTLVLVALLIVALSSVDSALSYLLALLLRKAA